MSEKDTWNLQNAPLTPHIRNAGRYINTMLGNHFPGINASIMNNLSLYMFLLNHIDTPDLYKRVTDKGVPLFTLSEMQEILKVIQSQKDSYFAHWLQGQQVGGATTLMDDPSRSKFWDKYIQKIGAPLAARIPPSWNGLLWYIFVLYNLEQNELLGPSISTLMDSITLSLPVIAGLAQEVSEKLVGLAPVPYASFVGEAIGTAVSLIFVLFAVGLNVSRKHFGSAFKAALEGIPIFGDILAEGAQSFETGAERYLINRGRWLKTVDRISPHAEDFLDYYIPDVAPKVGPAPSFNMERVKANVASFVARETGVTAALSKASSFQNQALGAFSGVQEKALGAVTGAVTGVQEKALGAVTGAVTSVQEKALGAVTGAQEKALGNLSRKLTFANLRRQTQKGGRKKYKHKKTYKRIRG